MSELALQRGIAAHRIGAMILRYWYLLLSSWPRLLELMYWPVLQVITWGFLQMYIAQNAGFFARAGGTLIGAVILWDILFRGQLAHGSVSRDPVSCEASFDFAPEGAVEAAPEFSWARPRATSRNTSSSVARL